MVGSETILTRSFKLIEYGAWVILAIIPVLIGAVILAGIFWTGIETAIRGGDADSGIAMVLLGIIVLVVYIIIGMIQIYLWVFSKAAADGLMTKQIPIHSIGYFESWTLAIKVLMEMSLAIGGVLGLLVIGFIMMDSSGILGFLIFIAAMLFYYMVMLGIQPYLVRRVLEE